MAKSQYSAVEQQLNQVLYQQDCIIELLVRLLRKENSTMALIDDLIDDVGKQTTVINGAVTLLDRLKAALDAAGTDPAKLASVRTMIATQSQAIAEAIARDTVASTEEAAPPVT